ncbi:hypothetical protein N7523_004662 [Penicillium sp. IBT 18751x]|nr:hypothetical protein N7523_004662 [Penicillium sp. IBT 18751x]
MGGRPGGLLSPETRIVTHSRDRDRNVRWDRGLGFPVSLELNAKPDHDPEPAMIRGIFHAPGILKLYRSPISEQPADSLGGSGGSWRSATDMHGSTGELMLNDSTQGWTRGSWHHAV